MHSTARRRALHLLLIACVVLCAPLAYGDEAPAGSGSGSAGASASASAEGSASADSSADASASSETKKVTPSYISARLEVSEDAIKEAAGGLADLARENENDSVKKAAKSLAKTVLQLVPALKALRKLFARLRENAPNKRQQKKLRAAMEKLEKVRQTVDKAIGATIIEGPPRAAVEKALAALAGRYERASLYLDAVGKGTH